MKTWSGKTGAVHCFGECSIDEGAAKNMLGVPHHVEDDPTRTHSGTELYWVFETDDGDALVFRFHQIIGQMLIGTTGDKTVAERIVAREFGLEYSPTHGLLSQ